MALTASAADSRFTVAQSSANAATSSTRPKTSAPMLTHSRVRNPQPLQDPNRLPILARGDEDLVPPLFQPLDNRPQHQRMRGGSAIDPDEH